MNNAESGSARLISVNFIVMSPERGSELFVKTATPNCFENHVSLVAIISRSLPTDPTGQLVVVRVPSAVTPSISCNPNDSEVALGLFPTGPFPIAVTGAKIFPEPATMSPPTDGVEAIVDTAGCAVVGRTAGIANFCATLSVEFSWYRKPATGSIMKTMTGAGWSLLGDPGFVNSLRVRPAESRYIKPFCSSWVM